MYIKFTLYLSLHYTIFHKRTIFLPAFAFQTVNNFLFCFMIISENNFVALQCWRVGWGCYTKKYLHATGLIHQVCWISKYGKHDHSI